MEKEAQRLAIAEACGKKCRLCNNTGLHKEHGEHEWFRVGNGVPFERQPLVPCEHGRHGWRTLPDYLNDLNAMHEAEKALTREQRVEMAMMLTPIRHIANIDAGKTEWDSHFDAIHSTASQRAEAFLRTLGKWTDA